MLRFVTAGESHGLQLTVVVDGMVAGLPLSARHDLDPDLRRRQGGYGRGGRQLIERDAAEITSGVRGGRTLGSPITLVIRNREWENWRKPMQAMMAWVLAQAMLDKFGGDSLAEVPRAVAAHRRRLR